MENKAVKVFLKDKLNFNQESDAKSFNQFGSDFSQGKNEFSW